MLLHSHVTKIICKTAVTNRTRFFCLALLENMKIRFFSKLFPFPFPHSSHLSKDKLSASQKKQQQQKPKQKTIGKRNKQSLAVMPWLLTRRLESGLEATTVQLLESLTGVNPGGHICECVNGAELPSHTTGMPSEACALYGSRKNICLVDHYRNPVTVLLPKYWRQYSLWLWLKITKADIFKWCW